jgi:hypothetical protein
VVEPGTLRFHLPLIKPDVRIGPHPAIRLLSCRGCRRDVKVHPLKPEHAGNILRNALALG